MAHTISNSDDIIDSRDIIRRIEELESERDSEGETAYDAHITDDSSGNSADDIENAADAQRQSAIAEWDKSDDGEELAILKALADEGSNSADDWQYGATLIRDSYFQQYAEELADDCGMIDNSAKWPLNCIDWKEAAEQLQQDYSSVDFDGVTYWIR